MEALAVRLAGRRRAIATAWQRSVVHVSHSALVTDPKIPILDEPFEGLGPESRTELVDLLRQLRAERGVTLTLFHRLSDRLRDRLHDAGLDLGSPSDLEDGVAVLVGAICDGRSDGATAPGCGRADG